MLGYTLTVIMQTPSFYVDWEECTFGTVYRDGSHSEGKSDFAIKFECLVEANKNTGYLCTVKRLSLIHI